MSDLSNDNLLERAQEVMAYFEGTDLETALANNLDNGDLEMVKYMVTQAEAEISRQEFHNNDMVSQNDVY